MNKVRIEKMLKSQKEKLYIELLYLRNKTKGITKSFIEFLVEQNLDNVIKLLNVAKSKEDFYKLIKENYQQLEMRSGNIFECLLTGILFGQYEASLNFIHSNVAKSLLTNNYTKADLIKIINQYSKTLTTYINCHNHLKHNLLPVEFINNSPVSDFRKEFTEENFKEVCNTLFRESTKDDYISKTEISAFIVVFLSMYSKEDIFTNPEFVRFELEYGYFDSYKELLTSGKSIPSMEERMKIFVSEKDITSQQHSHLKDIDLLEKRISSLKSKSKDLVLKKIELLRAEPDLKKKASLIDECFEYYEKTYRKEIVDSLYTPHSSVEITSFTEIETVMIHIFLRDPMRKLPEYRKQLKKDIIEGRPVKVTEEQELTPEEYAIYQSKLDYAINVLLNPVITSESLEGESIYSDSTGYRWYKSNTSNQISTSVMSIEGILRQGNCVGVGFDRTSISPENIIISSSGYQTTNMGVNNLEVEPNDHFANFSAPLSELVASRRTELFMYRRHNEMKTNAAYVFAIINGYDEEKDRQTIEQAREYAEKNNIKLIVFNNYKIRKSYEEMLQDETIYTEEDNKIKR